MNHGGFSVSECQEVGASVRVGAWSGGKCQESVSVSVSVSRVIACVEAQKECHGRSYIGQTDRQIDRHTDRQHGQTDRHSHPQWRRVLHEN